MKTTYFMRHGDFVKGMELETVSEANQKVPLSEEGKRQVREAKIPKDIDVIVVSDSLRIRQTADIILESNNLTIPIIVENSLYPWNAGTTDWKTYYDRFQDFMLNYSPTADYESKESLRSRLQIIIDKYSNKNILIIAHSTLLAVYLNRKVLDYAEIVQVH